jgi:hypothetical protein
VFARELANGRADVVTPGYLQRVAQRLAIELGLEITAIVGEAALRTNGLHMLAAVRLRALASFLFLLFCFVLSSFVSYWARSMNTYLLLLNFITIFFES